MEYENIIQRVDLRFWSQLRYKRTTRSISDRFAPQGRKKVSKAPDAQIFLVKICGNQIFFVPLHY